MTYQAEKQDLRRIAMSLPILLLGISFFFTNNHYTLKPVIIFTDNILSLHHYP